MWNNWLGRQYRANDGEFYSIVEWTETFIHDGLLPEMKKRGYVFPTNEQGIVSSFLNFLFHFERSYNTQSQCKYIGSHGRKMEWSNEDYSYFLDMKCTTEVWDKLRMKFPIEHFADSSDFADRLWTDMPSAVFFMIDLKNSPSSDELSEHLAWLDSDDEESSSGQHKKVNKIDPYLLDYGKDKYKYTESETRL